MLKQDYKTEVASLNNEVISMTKGITPTPKIKNDKQYEVAREHYKKISMALNFVTSKKKAILSPLSEAVNQIKSFFNPIEKHLEAMADEYSYRLGEYANAKEIKRIEELKRIERDKRLTNIETIQALKEEAGERLPGTMRIKKLVIYDEALIPNEYWMVDEKKVKEALLAGKIVKGARLDEVLTVTSK